MTAEQRVLRTCLRSLVTNGITSSCSPLGVDATRSVRSHLLILLQVRKRLEQIVDHWRGKNIYDGDTAAAMVAAMLTAKPSATIPEPGEKVRRLMVTNGIPSCAFSWISQPI